MGCGTDLVKYLFFAFNVIFWILGIVVFAIGIYSRVESDSWQALIDVNTIFEAANLLIAAGVIVAILGFFGCCGAIKKWQWMLVAYSILVILIFILEVAAGGYAYQNREKVQNQLTKGVKGAVQTHYGMDTDTGKIMKKAVDWFQEKVKCCGANNASDWENTQWKTQIVTDNSTVVPKSCCKTQTDGCNSGDYSTIMSNDKIYTSGCIEEGKKYAKQELWLIGGVGVGIAIVELLAIGFAMFLCCSYRKEDATSSA